MKNDKKKETPCQTRRAFLGGTLATGITLTQACSSFNIVPRHVLGGKNYVPPSEKMNIAIIGAGGKGFSDMEGVASENIAAICDVDWDYAKKAFAAQPKAAKYYDYREMFAKEKSLDAVVVSTPDHTHAPASLMAMQHKLHVYCQKPLTHDVFECRQMREAADKYGVITQMGNQGTSEDGLRTAVEIIRSGAIGPIKEIHVWTNRPIWPQAIPRPTMTPAVPETLRWDLFLGTASQDRPYNPAYHPFKWRGWWDFGTGALGDMACHTANMAFMACDLEYPTHIEAETSELFPETPPKWAIIKYKFPARGKRPACDFYWYDGGKMPPKDLTGDLTIEKSGSLIVGEKGMLFSPNDYGAKFQLLPEKNFKDYVNPKQTLPRSPGHYKEWIEGCKGGPLPMSNFEYAARLTETVLLGNLAVRSGTKIEWDAKNMKVTNSNEANQYVKRQYTKGFEV